MAASANDASGSALPSSSSEQQRSNPTPPAMKDKLKLQQRDKPVLRPTLIPFAMIQPGLGSLFPDEEEEEDGKSSTDTSRKTSDDTTPAAEDTENVEHRPLRDGTSSVTAGDVTTSNETPSLHENQSPKVREDSPIDNQTVSAETDTRPENQAKDIIETPEVGTSDSIQVTGTESSTPEPSAEGQSMCEEKSGVASDSQEREWAPDHLRQWKEVPF